MHQYIYYIYVYNKNNILKKPKYPLIWNTKSTCDTFNNETGNGKTLLHT